jgi:PhnB protein
LTSSEAADYARRMAKVNAIPEGFHTVTPQLSLENAAEAIELYKKAFGAEERSRAIDPSGKKVWHCELRIGNSPLFVNDVFPEMGGKPFPASMWLYVENVDQAFQRAVAAGCKATMPPADMFWGDRFSKVVDKWDMTPDEMKKAEQAFVASMKPTK